MSTWITASDYQKLLNEDITTLPTAYVDSLLEAACEDVENWCGRPFGVQAYTNEATQARVVQYQGQTCLRVEVSSHPLTAVTGLDVWYAVDVDPTTVAVTDAVIEPGGRSFVVPFGAFGLWTHFYVMNGVYTARVSYVAGAAVPTVVKRAAVLLVQEALAHDAASSKSGTDQLGSYRLGNYSETAAVRDVAASEGLGLGTANSIMAAKLLTKYRDTGVVFL